MKSRHITFLVVSTALTVIAQGKDAEDSVKVFEEGVTAVLENNDTETAIRKFEEVAEVSHSVNLHANLAKLYSNKKRYGKAVLHFKRALLLEPSNVELQEGLKEVREVAGLNETEEKPFFSHQRLGTWSLTTAALFWTGLILWLFPFRPTLSVYVKKVSLVIGAAMTAFSAYATWESHHSFTLLKRQAVVVTSSESNNTVILLRNNPITDSNEGYEMKAGGILRIEEKEDSSLNRYQSSDGTIWFYAETPSGKKHGWIKKFALEFLLP